MNQYYAPVADLDFEIFLALTDGEEWRGVPEDIALPKWLEFEPVVLRGAWNAVNGPKDWSEYEGR